MGRFRPRSRRSRFGLGLAALAALAATVFRPDRAIHVLTGFISHTVCSSTFVSGLDPDTVYDEVVRPLPGVFLFDWALRTRTDRARREVNTTLGSAFESRALYRGARGCRMATGDEPPSDASMPPRGGPAPSPSAFAGADVVRGDTRFEAALDRAFEEPPSGPRRRTKAVVVVHDGRVVAERYAPGYGVDTPLLGFSAAKSVVNALVGILVRQGRLNVDGPAPVSAWSSADDPRRRITADHLLRMTSGLALAETHSGFDPLSQMLFLEPDMAGYAERARLVAEPGRRFEYTGGNTLLLSRIVRDAAGGTGEGVLRFAQRELFEPAGIASATVELDAAGTPVGSTYMLATARDWGRFGMVYLDDGVVNGRRILPEGWTRYSASQTLDTRYGAGFWRGAGWGWPPDSFFASGMLGQHVVIVPSRRLVVVRFGVTHGVGDERAGVGRLLEDVLVACSGPPAGGLH